ncbi:hypothetical protein B484DRAFT_31996, partial [Ochromonadaceae sp. CCMP2298]
MSGDSTGGASGEVVILSGLTDMESPGMVSIKTGDSNAAGSGIFLQSGAGLVGGSVSIASGVSKGETGGALDLVGDKVSLSSIPTALSGALDFSTGASDSSSGSIGIRTGDSTDGRAGSIAFSPGTTNSNIKGASTVIQAGDASFKTISQDVNAATVGGDLALMAGSSSRGGEVLIQSGAGSVGTGGAVMVEAGAGRAASSGGDIVVNAGVSTQGVADSGVVYISGGDAPNGAAAGSVSMQGGSASAGAGGVLTLQGGVSEKAASGSVNIHTPLGAASGEISIATGASASSGDISVSVGSGSTKGGSLSAAAGQAKEGGSVVLAAGSGTMGGAAIVTGVSGAEMTTT